MEQEMNQEVEIDLIHLIKIILRKWILIGIITIAAAIVAGGYSYVMLDDEYVAETTMVLQTTSSDIIEFSKSNRVLEILKINLGIENSTNELRGMISIGYVSGTSIIKLSVTHTDPVLAKRIANELVVVLKSLSSEFEGLENIRVLDAALTPANPSGPNRMLYIVVGILLGGMIGVGLVLGVELLDKDIKTTKDIENVLGLRLLGSIPKYDIEEMGKKYE